MPWEMIDPSLETNDCVEKKNIAVKTASRNYPRTTSSLSQEDDSRSTTSKLQMGKISPSTTLLPLLYNVPLVKRLNPRICKQTLCGRKFTLSTSRDRAFFYTASREHSSTVDRREKFEFTTAEAAAQLLGLNTNKLDASVNGESDTSSNENQDPEDKQRRRKAHEIARLFQCCFCIKSYGTLSALTLHLRYKHTSLVRQMMALTDADPLEPIHSRSVAAYVNNALTDKHSLPSYSPKYVLETFRDQLMSSGNGVGINRSYSEAITTLYFPQDAAKRENLKRPRDDVYECFLFQASGKAKQSRDEYSPQTKWDYSLSSTSYFHHEQR